LAETRRWGGAHKMYPSWPIQARVILKMAETDFLLAPNEPHGVGFDEFAGARNPTHLEA